MSSTKIGSARHVYMDGLRLIGCFLVVCLHMSTMEGIPFSATSMEWKLSNIMDSVGMTGIVFFFMLSGALFLRNDKEMPVKYVWKKIGMLFLVYMIALFAYSVIPFVRGWEPWEWYYIKIDIVDRVLNGNAMYHLGFLPSLMVLYALSPVWKDAFASKENCEYFLILFAIFGATIPFLLRFDLGVNSYLQSFQNRFGLSWLTGHIGYFVLGHYLHEYGGKLNRKKCMIAVLTIAGTMALTLYCNHCDAVSKNQYSMIANTPLSITVFLFAISVYMLVKTGLENCQSERGIRIIKYFSSLTFGIYLIHPFILDNLMPLIPWNEAIGNYGVLVIIQLFVTILVSGAVTAILKLIPGVKWFL